MIRRWVGLVMVTNVIGRGKGLSFVGEDHIAGGSDKRVEEDVVKDGDEDGLKCISAVWRIAQSNR